MGVPPLEQANRLLVACVAVRVRAFRFRVILVLPNHFTVCLHARGLPAPMIVSSRNAVFIAAELIDPGHLEPLPGIRLVWRDQVEPFGIDSQRMTHLLYVTRQKKIERLYLRGVGLPVVESRQCPHHRWATDGNAPDSGPFRESEWLSF